MKLCFEIDNNISTQEMTEFINIFSKLMLSSINQKPYDTITDYASSNYITNEDLINTYVNKSESNL